MLKKFKSVFLFVVVFFLTFVATGFQVSYAQVFQTKAPDCFGFQGFLQTGGSSSAPYTGTATFEFRMYSQASGGVLLHDEVFSGVQVASGTFNLEICGTPKGVIQGGKSIYVGGLQFEQQLYYDVVVTVGSTTEVLRSGGSSGSAVPVDSTIYAMRSAQTYGIVNGTTATATPGAGNVVYQTSDKQIYYHNGTTWLPLTSGSSSSAGNFTTLNSTGDTLLASSPGSIFTLGNTTGTSTALGQTITVGNPSTSSTVNIGNGSAADTINIGTNTTTPDTINLGSPTDTLNLQGTTNITGNTNITGALALSGAANLGNDLTVTGNTSLNGNSTIGDSNADSLSIVAVIKGSLPLVFEGPTVNGVTTSFAISDPTNNNTITFPDASGTVLLSSNGWQLGGNAVTAVSNIGTSSNFDLPIITNNAERMRISAAGNIGIGTSTPTSLLDITATNFNTSTGKIFSITKNNIDLSVSDVVAEQQDFTITTGASGRRFNSMFIRPTYTGTQDIRGVNGVSIDIAANTPGASFTSQSQIFGGSYRIQGATNTSALYAFQTNTLHEGSGTVAELNGMRVDVGFGSGATGVIGQSNGFYFAPRDLGSGVGASLGVLRGLYLRTIPATLDSKTTSKWPIYSEWNYPSYFAGNIGIGTTGATAGLDVRNGGICTKAGTAACSGNAAGTVYADTLSIQAADLAENYVSSELLEPGDVVEFKQPGFIQKTRNSANPGHVFGVVSTAPAMTMNSGVNTDTDHPFIYPVALIGKVPVKVSDENGLVQAGDFLVPSQHTLGAVAKARVSSYVLGRALETQVDSHQASLVMFVRPEYWIQHVGEIDQTSLSPTDTLLTSIPARLDQLNMANAAVFGDLAVSGSVYIARDLYVDGKLVVKGDIETQELRALRVVGQQICAGNTCVNEEQLRKILESQTVQVQSQSSPASEN